MTARGPKISVADPIILGRDLSAHAQSQHSFAAEKSLCTVELEATQSCHAPFQLEEYNRAVYYKLSCSHHWEACLLLCCYSVTLFHPFA
jgi:hypothetical protein